MQERLLQFIWQFQYFNRNQLETADGELLTIFKTGYLNTNQGPDFIGASIKIGEYVWFGNVEVHINASDWIKHDHSKDKNYRNVILHVVWNNDWDSSIVNIPLFELQSRVPKVLLEQYNEWMKTTSVIPCAGYALEVDELIWSFWKERLMIERLERKSKSVRLGLKRSQEDWEEIFWQWLARSYGLKVNADAFEEMARTVKYKELVNKSSSDEGLGSLLYNILQTGNNPLLFSRIRPAASPMIRVRKLAALISRHRYLIDIIFQTQQVKQLRPDFLLLAIINAVIPFIYLYGNYYNREDLIEKSLQWLKDLPAEKNSITLLFEKLGAGNCVVADSQAFIELYSQYCYHKRCLDCAIGNAILKRKK